jgi:hypothetical protein
MGPQGPAGPRGPAERIELITCRPHTKIATRNVHGKRRKVRVNRLRCTGRRLAARLTTGATGDPATISRGRIVYATGISVTVDKRDSLLLLTQRRAMPDGRYTLTLRRHHSGRTITLRRPITFG